MLELLAPGSIPGAALIILFEAEVGLGFKHPSPQLCSCSSEPPTPCHPDSLYGLDLCHLTHLTSLSGLPVASDGLMAFLGPLLPLPHPSCLSCPCWPPLAKALPCHQRSPPSLWHVGRTCPSNHRWCHRHTGGCRTERLRAQALKSDFLVQILVASYQSCKSSHVFSASAYRIGTVWELLTANAYNKRFSNLLFVLGAFLSFWLLHVNNSSSVCLPTAVFTPCLSISSLS